MLRPDALQSGNVQDQCASYGRRPNQVFIAITKLHYRDSTSSTAAETYPNLVFFTLKKLRVFSP